MKPRQLLLTTAGLVVLLGGCTMTVRDDDPYAVRERQLELRVDRLDQLFKNNTLESLAQQQQQTQDQLRELRGDVEVLQHNMDLSKQQQRDLYLDLDRRLQKLELGVNNSVGATAAPTVGTGAAATAAPGSIAAPATVTGGDQAAYQQNFALLKQGRYEDAIDGFTGFIQKYPQSALVPNAEFWMGEANYQMSDFKGALVNFQAVVQNYPQSNKAADALLKVGYCQYELRNWKAARKTLTSVEQKYPGSSAARLAKQRLQRIGKEGH